MSTTEKRLVISFAPERSADATEKWWLRIEAGEPEQDTATPGEVAQLIDAIFDIEPCDSQAGNSGGAGAEINPDTGQEEPPVEEEEFKSLVATHMPSAYCAIDDGRYEAAVRVYRSHPAEPYNLVVINGEVLETRRMEDAVQVNLTVNKASSVDLGLPVLSGFQAWFDGTVYDRTGAVSGPEITLRGSTVSFGREVTGRLRASFVATWDEVTVRVDAMDGDPQTGRLVAFYHGMAWEGEVEPPAPEESTDNVICERSEGPGSAECAERTCLKHVRHYSRCACTGETVLEYEEEPQEVPCPDDWCWGYDGPNLYESVFDGYESGGDCPETTGQVSNPAYYEDVCCHQPEVALPRCIRTTRKATGGVGIDGGQDRYRRIYGDNARFVAVAPADGDCGKITVEQVPFSRNCCDEATPLRFSADNSVTVIADHSSAFVEVLGGIPPYTWSVRGNGFWLDAARTMRDGVTDSSAVVIYTSDACGICIVSCTDGCSSASWELTSFNGSWVLVNIDDYRGVVGRFYGAEPDYYDLLYWFDCGTDHIVSRTVAVATLGGYTLHEGLGKKYSGRLNGYWPARGRYAKRLYFAEGSSYPFSTACQNRDGGCQGEDDRPFWQLHYDCIKATIPESEYYEGFTKPTMLPPAITSEIQYNYGDRKDIIVTYDTLSNVYYYICDAVEGATGGTYTFDVWRNCNADRLYKWQC